MAWLEFPMYSMVEPQHFPVFPHTAGGLDLRFRISVQNGNAYQDIGKNSFD